MAHPLDPPAKTVTVASGAALSGVLDTEGLPLVALVFPAAMTSVTCTLHASSEPTGTFVAVRNADGTAPSITVTVSTVTMLNNAAFVPLALAGLRYVKLAFPGNEAAARSIVVLLGARRFVRGR